MTPEEKKVFEQMREALSLIAWSNVIRSPRGSKWQQDCAREALAAANAVQPQPQACKDCGQSTKQDLIHTCSPQVSWPKWQPIETAPRDGRRIFLFPAIEVADTCSKGHWSEEYKCWIVGGSPSGIEHTHWQPMPPAPEAA